MFHAREVGPDQQMLQVQLFLHLMDFLGDIIGRPEQQVPGMQPFIGEQVQLAFGFRQGLTRENMVAQPPVMADPFQIIDDTAAGELLCLGHGFGYKHIAH